MCGIAGIVHFDGSPIPEGLPERMCAAIRHRGPDDSGVVRFPRDETDGRRPRAALGNQRLSIIDLAGGRQPIGNEDGTVWTVLNGEIYNFKELRSRLERNGHRFATRSDTEVIVHAYEQWGDSFVGELDGMFALAIWDGRSNRLVLGRDRFGKKPLLYFEDRQRIAFASEFQSLLTVSNIDRAVDAAALGTYLAYMAIPAPLTIYQQVKKVPPAHVLTCDATGTTVRRYWSLTYQPKKDISEAEAVECTRHLLKAAVKKRLISEVPLGAFLSGGVDSSVVVGLMAELSGQPVKTFSIGFEDAQYDELPHARRVSREFQTDHQEFVVRPAAVEILPAMARHFGEPFADSSAIPSWYLAKMTRSCVTVALTGDGGDEVFGGYGRHLGNRLAEQWQSVPRSIRRSAELVARNRMLSEWGGTRATRFAAAARLSRADRYRTWAGVFSEDLAREMAPIVSAVESSVPEAFASVAHLDAVDSILAVDSGVYLPSDLLVKADITSMAHSLEVRSPLLDRDLAEFVASLPSSMKIRGLTTKHLLKRAADGLVPRANLRRAKQGFAVPIARWLRQDLKAFAADHLSGSTLGKAGLLRQPAVDKLLEEHRSGAQDRAHHIWVLLMLELWHRTFVTA